MKYRVTYDVGVLEYEVEADNPDEALMIADNMFAEFIPEVDVEEVENED